MKKAENTPRTLEVLVQEFKNSVGNFATFNRNMSARERTVFKGWLNQLRTSSQLA
jgi:hypothetical protein